MTVKQFISKWAPADLKEISFAQSHFNDICELIGYPNPIKSDPTGSFFTFEVAARKLGGRKGRADVWLKNHFIWEYKGSDDDFDYAFGQLQLYRESLGNPPLLIVSDAHTIIISTNFTNTAKRTYVVKIEELSDPDKLDLIQRVFFKPESFKPDETQEKVTEATAERFVKLVYELRQWNKGNREFSNPEQFSHFIIQLLFCLFAEDIKLLPNSLFTESINLKADNPVDIINRLEKLFKVMQSGGDFGLSKIPYFDGTLFDSILVPQSLPAVKSYLTHAAELDWSSIDPTIFGTLFERIIDESKRSQLGAHYTGIDDISLIIEPVIMHDLREEWREIQHSVQGIVNHDKTGAYDQLNNFSIKISTIKILDPACGSGNFLYVALRALLDLQKQVIVYTKQLDLGDLPLTVNPHQLFGLEIDPYAHQLAQIVIWIGYIQWRYDNGFQVIDEPILKPLHQIIRMDSILGHNNRGEPISPKWPSVDYIVGNPPFLGSRKMRPELGNPYCDQLLEVYGREIEGMPDLVCYWFVKSLKLLNEGVVKRVGLLATQAIRGGTNRQIMDHIVTDGEIFNAWSDRDWLQDGAKVHVSIVCFHKGTDSIKLLNGQPSPVINSHLDSGIDLSKVEALKENGGISFQGVVLRGQFNISKSEAERMINSRNGNGINNQDVLKIRKTGEDILGKNGDSFVIDFGIDMPEEEARQYELPYAYIKEHVLPLRLKANQESAKALWWIHWNTRTQMRNAISHIPRYIATPRVAKHRIFVWLDRDVLPDAQLIIFARSDDYFFGVLHSRVHEVWARRQGTQLRDSASGFRYTPKSVFRPFPMPFPIGEEQWENPQIVEISSCAFKLDEFRKKWMYPDGVGSTLSEITYRKRTLTNLYNALEFYRAEIRGRNRDELKWNKVIGSNIISIEEIEELDRLHFELDRAVFSAYEINIRETDDVILRKLSIMNHNRPHSEDNQIEPEDDV